VRVVWVAVLCLATSAHAEDDPYYGNPRWPRFERDVALSGGWGGVREQIASRGLTFDLIYSAEMFGTPSLDGRFETAGLALLGIDLDLGLAVDERFGAFHVSGLALHGDDLSEHLGDVFGTSNITGDPEVRLFEAWYEQPFGPLAIRAGLLAADLEYVLAPHSQVLINDTFGIIAQIPAVATAPVFPVAAPALSARLELGHVTARVGIFDGAPVEAHGSPTKLGDDALVFAEVVLGERVKLGTWQHTRGGDGYYAILDSRLGSHLAGFARVGIAPSQDVDLYADAGIRLGPMFDRDFASAGLAYARTPSGLEVVSEVTYQYRYAWLILQPDLQVLMQRARTSVILGTRLIIVL
jgi:hypothetical protein